MTNPTPHGQVPEVLIDLIDAYAETRHRCGGIYNAKTEAARKAVIEALSGVQALSAAPAVPNGDELRRIARSARTSASDDASPTEYVLAGWKAAMLAASPTPPAEQQAAPKAAPGEPTQEFEKWLATYSTLSAARDVNGYADLTTEMLWHAWQAAAKTKAPEDASAEWIDANARPGLALTNCTCAHDFSVQPSSGIRLCQKCGISETAARKAAPQQEAQEPALFVSAKQLADLVDPSHATGGSYLPARKTRAGLFTQPLYTAPQPAPAPLSDDVVKDAARWRWLSEHIGVAWNEGKFTSLVRIVSDKNRTALNASIDRMMAGDWSDAALAAQGGKDA